MRRETVSVSEFVKPREASGIGVRWGAGGANTSAPAQTDNRPDRRVFYPLCLTPALRQRPQVYIRSVWAQKHRTSGRQEGRCLLRCRRRKSDKIPKFDAEDAAGLPA
jgi:hypothetical protein